MKCFIRLLMSAILLICGHTNISKSQSAAILPNAVTQFFDNDGNPLSLGRVYFYIPSTSTFKSTWQDANETILNVNPVLLDGAGRAIIFGTGAYRQVVEKANGDLVWDALTYSPGSGGGGGAQTGDGDLVGTVKPWAGLAAPNQYVFAYGQEITRAGFPAFYTAVTQTSTVACSSGSAVLTGLADTSQIPIGAAIEVICVAPSTTVIGKTSTTLTLSAVSGLTTNATAVIFPYGNGNGSTTFNVPDLRGYILSGRDNMGGSQANVIQVQTTITTTAASATATVASATSVTAGMFVVSTNVPAGTFVSSISGTTVTLSSIATGSGGGVAAVFSVLRNANAIGAKGGKVAHIQTIIELAQHTHTIPDHDHVMRGTSAAAQGGGTFSTINQASGFSPGGVQSFGVTNPTSLTAAGTGQSAAMPTVPPIMSFNYIIKITPDTNSAVATGVLSLGGMTGVIACGSGLSCTGNIVSVTGSGTGTVTSVGLTMPGIFSVGGSPVTTTGTLAVTAAGTSGGVPYFNSGTTLASSGALTVNSPVIGGGAGAAPTVGTRSGNTTAFVTTTGAQTSGNCVSIDASGNHIAFGAGCGSGTVNSGTINQVAYYAGAGTAISGNSGLTINSGALTIGVVSSITGTVVIPGFVSGSGTIRVAGVAGTSTIFQLPNTNGISGNVLSTDGSGNTSWVAIAGTGTVTSVAAGTGMSFVTITGSGNVDIDKASLTNYYAATSNKVVTTDTIYVSENIITYGATTTFDFDTFINSAVNLTGNITTMTLTNLRTGKAGSIRFIQDSTGGRTTVWNTNLKFAGGTTPTLSTAAKAVDVLVYNCITSSYCVANLIKATN